MLCSEIKAKVCATDLETFLAICHKRLKTYLVKSDITTRRNTNEIIFLLLRAIGKIEDSAVKNTQTKKTKTLLKEFGRIITDPYQQS